MSEEERERLGRLVREVWVEWAREQPSPKPHHLLPWEALDEGNREVDRRIGEAVARTAIGPELAVAARLRADLAASEAQVARLRAALSGIATEAASTLADENIGIAGWGEGGELGDSLIGILDAAQSALAHVPAPPPAVPAGLLCFCLSCGHEDRRRELTIPTPCPACEAPRLWTVATVAMELRQRPPAAPDALALAAGRYRTAVVRYRDAVLADDEREIALALTEHTVAQDIVLQRALEAGEGLRAALEQEPRQ